MSLPRMVLPGKTYLLTRRCFGRLFLLRPCPRTNQILKFCLAVAAARTGCLVHAFCCLSNHYHLIVTDPEGRLPEFMHWFNEFVAKCVNAELGRWESFWAPGSYSRVELLDREKLLGELVYVFTNPVTAGLVRSHEKWPGVRSQPRDTLGWTEIIDRPQGFFGENGKVPDSATLTVVPPNMLEQEGSNWCSELCKLVATREREIRAEFRKKRKRFLGSRQVLTQTPIASPRSVEPRRGLNPRVAAGDKWKRIEALQLLKSFLKAYREAWKSFVEGDRLTVFPAGTYWMRVRIGVLCHEP